MLLAIVTWHGEIMMVNAVNTANLEEEVKKEVEVEAVEV